MSQTKKAAATAPTTAKAKPAAKSLPVKKSAPKTNPTAIIKKLSAPDKPESKKPQFGTVVAREESVKKWVKGATLVKRKERAEKRAEEKAAEKAAAKAEKASNIHVVEVPEDGPIERFDVKPVQRIEDAEVIEVLEVETDDERFEREYRELEAESNPSTKDLPPIGDVIEAALTGGRRGKGNREKTSIPKQPRAKKQKDENGLPALPDYSEQDKDLEFTKEEFFRLKRIVDALAMKPNLRIFLASNM